MPKRKFKKPAPGKCRKLPNGAWLCRSKTNRGAGQFGGCYRIMNEKKAKAFMRKK